MTTKLAAGTAAPARLIEKQMRTWELARAQRPADPEPSRRPEVEDFICISRMVGVDGHTIAAALGKRLGWPLFDRAILGIMAGDDFDRRQIYASMDQRDLSWTEDMVRSLMTRYFGRNDYFHRLCETQLSLARKSPSIFLGRAADLILPRRLGFRVRLMAPRAARVASLARGGASRPEAAEAKLDQIESERTEFFRNHFHIAASEPTRHDLAINVESYPPDAAVELILAAREIHRRALRPAPPPA